MLLQDPFHPLALEIVASSQNCCTVMKKKDFGNISLPQFSQACWNEEGKLCILADLRLKADFSQLCYNICVSIEQPVA